MTVGLPSVGSLIRRWGIGAVPKLTLANRAVVFVALAMPRLDAGLPTAIYSAGEKSPVISNVSSLCSFATAAFYKRQACASQLR